jgi:hypothetical protein
MCALQAALFLLQPDSFSCGNAHPFNRLSSCQVTRCVCPTDFQLFHAVFQFGFSLHILSFHEPDDPLLLPSIEPIQPVSHRSRLPLQT